MSNSEKLEIAWKINGYINEYIRFADTKAVVFIGFYVAAFGYFGAQKQALLDSFYSCWLILSPIAIATVIGFWQCLSVVWPRTHCSPFGHVSWPNIARFTEENDYLQSFTNVSLTELEDELVKQNYQLASITAKKYKSIRTATLWLMFNMLGWVVLMFCS